MKCITSIQPRPLPGNRFRSTWVHSRFLVGFVLLDLEFHVYVSRWLFVLLYFFLCPLCCVFFCLRILITSLLFTDSDYLFVNITLYRSLCLLMVIPVLFPLFNCFSCKNSSQNGLYTSFNGDKLSIFLPMMFNKRRLFL
jgi:hypothetical protein